MTNTLLEESLHTCVLATSEAAPRQINLLPWSAPFSWLKLGWRDIAAHPFTSFFYGLPFWCMALFFKTLMPSDFDVMEAAISADNWEFVISYAVVGGAFAALVFSLSVGLVVVGPLLGHASWRAYRDSVRWP